MSSTARDRKNKKGSKDVAAERLSTPDQLDQIIRVATFPSWLLLGAMVILLVGAVAAAFKIPVPVTVAGQGILIDPGGILTVVSETEGRLRDLSVEIDETIERGQVVAEISQPELVQEIASVEDALKAATERREEIQRFQETSRTVQDEGIAQQRSALVARRGFAIERLENLSRLFEKQESLPDLYPEIQRQETMGRVNRARDELNTIENEIRSFREVISTRDLDNQRELLQLALEIGDLQREVRLLNAELEQKSRIHSPYSGKVVEIKVNEGDVIARHDALFSLLPQESPSPAPNDDAFAVITPDGEDASASERANNDLRDACRDWLSDPATPENADSLVAVLYVPSVDGKKIDHGDVVQLELGPFKREKFGFLLGCVDKVAEVPSTRKGMMRVLQNSQLVDQLSGASAPFEVRVRLLRDQTPTGYRWSSGRGPNEQIYVGTLGEAYIVTETLQPIDMLLPRLTDLNQDRDSS